MARTLLALSALALSFACSRPSHSVELATAEPLTTIGAGPDSPGRPVSLVELFTSEGCSSCPSADAVVNALPSRAADRDVIAVAWHVDYWDSIGWPDPYASAAYTERQRQYATALAQSSIYTPEIVLDGAESSRSALSSIASQTTRILPMSLSFTAAGNTLSVKYAAANAPANARVIVVVVESGLSQHPSRGENAGRTLAHDHVARVMKTAPSPSGELSIEVPPSVDRSRAALVAFAELPVTMQKLAAARVPLR